MSFAQDQEQPPKPGMQLDHRYEGIAKVTGKARYAAEFSDPFSKADLVYAYIVQATIPSGSVKSIDIASARRTRESSSGGRLAFSASPALESAPIASTMMRILRRSIASTSDPPKRRC